MKVNDYVRIEDGGIGKVIEIICSYDKKNDNIITDNNTIAKGWDGEQVNDTYRNAVVKSSPNIIDLIEVGDYVNGRIVEWIGDEFVAFGRLDYAYEKDIKSIVTKEQFESMEYKVR